MKLNTLVKTNVKKIRPGRGIGSGKGKTGGRGIKGQNQDQVLPLMLSKADKYHYIEDCQKEDLNLCL